MTDDHLNPFGTGQIRDILWGQVKWSNIGLSKGSESIWGHESIWGQVKSGDIRWEQVKYCPLGTGQNIMPPKQRLALIERTRPSEPPMLL
jgi:hypothetical protein